jgi:hypothetical protein
MRIFFVVLSLVLASCTTIDPQIESDKFTGPGDRTAYSMVCNGIGQTLEACYQRANALCPNGYDVLNLVTLAIGGNPRESLSIECKSAIRAA